jgi:outer membrane protein insertion porin family
MRRRWLTWPFVVSALLLCGLATRAAGAQGTIAAIEITGHRTVEPETIRTRLQFAKGSAYDPAKVDQSIKALFATGIFSDVHIERRGTTVYVRVVENPIVSAVSFEGQRAIDKPKLEPLVHLKPRLRYTAARAHADTVRLREFYRRQGRLATTIESKTVDRGEGRVDVVYLIREGEVTKIDSISFVGNRAFSPSQLRDVISTSQSGWLDILKSAAFYDPERIDRDKELLRRHYLKNGFPDSRVRAAEAVKNAEGTGYGITFTVEEGERYVFGAVTFDSKLPGVDTGALQSSVAIKPGSTYNLETVDKSVEALSLALSDKGHAFARVKAVPKRHAAGRTMDIGFLIAEGPRVHVERIDVVGNKKTKDFVIRREFRVAEGEPVNAFLIERGRKRVRALGFFKSVDVTHKTGSAPDQTVLTIEVVEDESNNLSFGVGYSMAEGVAGDISLTERNFLGNGQWLRLNLAGSLTRLQADIGFTEPRFLGTNLAAGFDLFYKDVDYTTQASYQSQKIGGTLRLGYPINEQWSTGVNYTFVRNQIHDVGSAASAAIKEAVPGFPNATSTTYYTSSVGYSLAYDTRDNKKRPSSGVYYTVAQDLAGLGGDVRFIRSVGEARGYYAVSDDVTAMGRATGGIITGWGGQDVRLLDLFYRGGETVRGFATAGIGPRDTQSVNQDALGGRMYYGTTAELLFKVPGVPDDLGLRGAVFADAGSLWSVNGTAASAPGLAGNTPALRASVGVGLAWDSPLGNLRVDYAYPILKQPFDKTQALSFGLRPF